MTIIHFPMLKAIIILFLSWVRNLFIYFYYYVYMFCFS